MEEKSNSSNHRKEDSSSHKQSDDSQKITNFFPLLKTEGRAKMCGLKTDDSKQKEMLKKMKGKESMTLRSKRLDKIQGKSVNGSMSSQGKEKVRNISVASALKTPLSQVLRKSIEASDKKESDKAKLNQTKILDTMGKNPSTETKKIISDSDSGMMLRQKSSVPEKPLRSNTTSKRRSEGNQIAAGNDKAATPSNTAEVKPHPARGRPPKVVTYADIVAEEGKSDSASVNSNNGSKVKKTYRKRHFRGSTYGLYLTPARKKKKKMKSQDESKDDECSVTSTENNSFLDSEDGNSLVSEDCFTPSEKSLVDEEHGLESQNSSTVLSIEKKCDSLGINSSIESEELNSSYKTNKDVKPEPKIEISADYEENTQNVTDLFQDLEEMQWESEQKGNEEVDNTNGSQTNKTPQYDDISSESFTNSLHFSFKKNSPHNSEETCTKDDLMVEDKCEEPASVSMSSNCDISDRADHQKIDLPETSETCLSINDNISEMFDLKDDSNVASSDMSENKDDLNLISSDLSEIKDDLNLESTDMLISKDSLNLVFSDVNEDKQESNLISSDVPKPKNLNLDSTLVSEKKCDVSPQSYEEKKKDSNLVSDDVNEHKNSEMIQQNDVTENKENNKSDSLSVSKSKENLNSPSYNNDKDKLDSDKLTFSSQKLDSQSVAFTSENKLDSNSPLFSNDNKQDSNSVPFSSENKQDSNSLSFSNENKQDSNSLSFINETKQDSNSLPSVENKSISNSPLFVSEKESDEPMEHSDANKNELEPLDSAKSTSGEVQDENKDKNDILLDSHMEVDNLDSQNDESDAQSTIATCVKSRQRIKRRFTDDIVDTDLGILSAAAMASVNKKAMTKQETHKDIIENFRAVSRSEVKKVGPVAKIECVFNYKQAPIKSCTCGGETYQAKTNDQNEEVTFCQAVDTIDDKLVGCCNPVVTSQLVRPSVKLPFITMCENHLWRLKHHHACPYCGLFCSQGTFIQCKNENNSLFRHFFHEQCQSKEDGSVPFCFHCGSSSSLKLVYVDMQMVSPPSFFLNQAGKVSVPDVSKARISFSESSDFTKKEDDEPSQTFRIEESGKVLSLAGLPKGSSKEELEKLITVLNEEKVRSCNYPTDELYDMAATGNVLKILYMLAKGLDPNQKFENHEGETALHAAAANGHVTVVHLLVQAGATRESLNEKMYTPLMLAVENGHKDVVYYLVKKGALTDFKGENGMSSLHLAAKSGNLDVLKILMSSRNVDINAQDDGGWTPIVWASEHDHLTVVNYLLKRGANPNLRDNEGNIGLHWSAFSGSVEISYLYLDYGCDINSVNELGDTPLHIAARQDSFPCVTLFLSRGADVTILNKAGKLPAECCIDRNSDTYLSLSLNLLLKKITGKYQHKAEKILHRDISRGKEQLAIQCVNAVDDEMPPLDFLYVTENCETMPIKIDRTITSLQSCHCEDDCSTASCSCASISYQCWYDKEGLLLPEFNLIDPPMLFECNRACSCWSLNCHNRVLQNGITCRLQLIRTKGKGWGVRTLKDIPKGAFICEYVGELISDSAADKRADDSYLFDLDNRDGETYCLDARYYGNISRFINHLCEPNLVPVKVYVDHQDLNFPRIAFFSSRDIKQYEELGFDYGEKFWAIKYKSFTCECGTPKCKYSKESIHITLSNYYRRLKEEQMEEAAAAQQPEVIQTE